jgi:hypothetical protein
MSNLFCKKNDTNRLLGRKTLCQSAIECLLLASISLTPPPVSTNPPCWLLISDWTPAMCWDLRGRGGGDSTETASYHLAEMAVVPSQISAECVFDKAIYF